MLTGNLNYYLKLDYNRPTIYRPLKLSLEAGLDDPQQARDVEPLLFKCWANVEDGGSTLKQHWLNVSCLLSQPLRLHFRRGTGSNRCQITMKLAGHWHWQSVGRHTLDSGGKEGAQGVRLHKFFLTNLGQFRELFKEFSTKRGGLSLWIRAWD